MRPAPLSRGGIDKNDRLIAPAGLHNEAILTIAGTRRPGGESSGASLQIRPESLPGNRRQLRRRWDNLHALHGVMLSVALVLLVASALVLSQSTGPHL